MNSLLKKYAPVGKIIWLCLVVIFAAWYLYKNFKGIINIFSILPRVNVIFICVFLMAGKSFLAANAYLSLRYSGTAVSFAKCFHMYNLSQLAKYIPGGIWHFIGRAGMYNQEGMKAAAIKKSMIREIVWMLTGALFTGILFIGLLKPIFIADIWRKYYRVIFVAGIAGFGISMLLCMFFCKKIKEVWQYIFSSPECFFKVLFVQLLIWVFLGLSFIMVVLPFAPDHVPFLYLIGIYALAYMIGFVVPFAPAGVGIREALLIWGLSYTLDMDTSIVLAGIHRVFYIVVEIMLVFAGRLMTGYHKK